VKPPRRPPMISSPLTEGHAGLRGLGAAWGCMRAYEPDPSLSQARSPCKTAKSSDPLSMKPKPTMA